MSTTNPTEQPNEKQGALHTPGPWTAAITDDGAEVFLDDNGPGRALIAEIEAQPEYASNALLIAAAPDLLAACQASMAYDAAIHRRGFMGNVQADGDEREHYATGADLDALYEDWITKARAAVEKAAGR